LKRIFKKLVVIVFLSLSAGCDTIGTENSSVASGGLVMERRMLPAQFKNESGVGYTANLDAIIVRPNDDKPHPLAVIVDGFDPYNYKVRYVDHYKRHAIEFARRGWVTVAFSRRGYGHSEGEFSERINGCYERALVHGAIEPTMDVREVIRLMKQQSYVDASRMIAIGQSGGGYTMMALAANPPEGLKAAINFAGGAGRANEDADACYLDVLTRVIKRLGRDNQIPMLWVYTENDRMSSMKKVGKMYNAFTSQGGNAELVTGIWFEDNGHNLFYSENGISIWSPYVDAFLQKHDLKLTNELLSQFNLHEVKAIDQK